jgi:hypothetical protein
MSKEYYTARHATDLAKGDYVLATKWGDGDPQDPWYVGFYDGFNDEWQRHFVVDADGKSARPGGFRRVKRINGKRGAWLLNHRDEIEQSSKSLWYWVRHKMTT